MALSFGIHRAKDVSALIANYTPGVLAFDLINPLNYRGSVELGKRAAEWFSSWQGDFAYEVQRLTLAASGNTTLGHNLNRLSGTQADGRPVDMWGVRVSAANESTANG